MPLSLDQVFQKFCQIEQQFDLFNQKIDGIHFWERIRSPVYQLLCEQLGVFGTDTSKAWDAAPSFFQKLKVSLRRFGYSLFHNPFLAPRAEILFWGHSRRKKLSDGKWWDIYCDPLINGLKNKSYVLIEPSFRHFHHTPVRTEHLYYSDAIALLTAVYRLFCKKRVNRSLESHQISFIKSLEAGFSNSFDVDLKLEAMIKRDLTAYYSQVPFMKALLRRIKPQKVIMVVAYVNYNLLSACKEMNIPVAELQHGVIDDLHPGYSFPNSPPKIAPDYFLSFGQYWSDFKPLGLPAERVLNVGYAYLEQEGHRDKFVKKEKQIIFLSQGVELDEKMSVWAANLAQKLPDYRIIYKLHPQDYRVDWRLKYPALMQKNIVVIADDNISLYQLLSESSVQVGVFSTALYEGIYFGLPTVILDLPGSQFMRKLIGFGGASFAKNHDELANLILSKSFKEFYSSNQSNYFFNTDALTNFKNEMDFR